MISINNQIEFNFAKTLANWLIEHEPTSKLIGTLAAAIELYLFNTDCLTEEQE
jgi:hypothetical protein